MAISRADVAGATNATVVIPNVQAASAGHYALIESNAFGAITDALYALSILDSPPVISEQPVLAIFSCWRICDPPRDRVPELPPCPRSGSTMVGSLTARQIRP